jgi:hypothetical protein
MYQRTSFFRVKAVQLIVTLFKLNLAVEIGLGTIDFGQMVLTAQLTQRNKGNVRFSALIAASKALLSCLFLSLTWLHFPRSAFSSMGHV